MTTTDAPQYVHAHGGRYILDRHPDETAMLSVRTTYKTRHQVKKLAHAQDMTVEAFINQRLEELVAQ